MNGHEGEQYLGYCQGYGARVPVTGRVGSTRAISVQSNLVTIL